MTDNTVLNPGSGGDTIRDVNRTGAVKTQVVQLDIGGAATNAEALVTSGQQTSANSLPVVIASDQAPIQQTGQYDRLRANMQMNLLKQSAALMAAHGGFVPLEIPEFLAGV
jgi:hypothetical protein